MGSDPAARAEKKQWMPRMWQGCDFFAWLKLLRNNHFAVEPRFLYIAGIDTAISLMNTILGFAQTALYGNAVRRTEFRHAPIFLLGHWRTGTTLLHDLMICDPRFGYPNTYQCLAPCHFLLTERYFAHLFGFLMPSQRPMDNMRMGFDRPQEDEFALALLTGDASPYLTIAFPNHPPQAQEYLDLQNLPPAKLRRWQNHFKQFLRQLTYKHRRRLVLKSPPHTARVRTLRQMFPDALFIHIVRDPYVVFPSTLNLWRSLYATHGFQVPNGKYLEEHVLSTYERMYARLEEAKAELDPRQFYELRYEDLVEAPLANLQRLYEHFGLGGWEEMKPRLEAYLGTIQGYETNKYSLSAEQHALVTQRWGDVIRRYGYERPTEMPAASGTRGTRGTSGTRGTTEEREAQTHKLS